MTRWKKWVLGVGVSSAGVALLIFHLTPPRLEVPPQDDLLLSPVTIINPGGDRRANQTLVVRAGHIESIADEAPPGPLPRLTRLLAGSYVVPGLIDMHVHLPPDVAGLRDYVQFLTVTWGVTTVCQTGDPDGTIFEARRRVRDGERAGPRIVVCGFLVDGDAPAGRLTRAVDSAAAAESVVSELATAGVDCIALAGTLTSEVVLAVRDAARRRGLPVFGHMPSPLPASDDANSNLWNAWQRLAASESGEVAQSAAEAGIPYVPTLLAWVRFAQLADSKQHPPRPARMLPDFFENFLWQPQDGLAFLGSQWGTQDVWWRGNAPRDLFSATQEADRLVALNNVLLVAARMRGIGVPLYAGTDAPNPFLAPGFSMYEEMRLLAQIGMTPEEAWAAATRLPGAALGIPMLGTIQAGAPADFLVWQRDPTLEIRATNPVAVVADGRFYYWRTSSGAAWRHVQHARRRLRSWLSMMLVRFAGGASRG
jgi:imidazolonepropionase-like amidohydrolase